MRWDLGPKTGEVKDFKTFDEFLEAFFKQLAFQADLACEYNNLLGRQLLDLIEQRFLFACQREIVALQRIYGLLQIELALALHIQLRRHGSHFVFMFHAECNDTGNPDQEHGCNGCNDAFYFLCHSFNILLFTSGRCRCPHYITSIL
ncbi:MAG: hypothetical protein J6S92_06380, partial [Oscillospiraceae bacterium]|nr:hypothetical protein [Oscillospiraceae bacterium]